MDTIEIEHRVAALKRERVAYEGRDDKKDRLKAVDAELSRLEGKSSDKPRESTAQGQVTRVQPEAPSTREEHVQGDAPQPDAAALEEPQTTTTPQADTIVEPEAKPDGSVTPEPEPAKPEAKPAAKPAAKKTAARKATAAKKA